MSSRSFFETLSWIFKEVASAVAQEVCESASAAAKQLSIYIENPEDAYEDLKEWASENKLTCTLLVGGAIVLIVPLAVGFAPGGIVGGSLAAAWQSSIGSVAAGSLFSILQSWGMTWTFITLGGWLMGAGGVKLLSGSFWRMFEGFVHRLRVGLLTGSTGIGGLGAPPDEDGSDAEADAEGEGEGEGDDNEQEDAGGGENSDDEGYYWNGSTDEEYASDSDSDADTEKDDSEQEDAGDSENSDDEGYYWNGSMGEEYDLNDSDSSLNGEEGL